MGTEIERRTARVRNCASERRSRIVGHLAALDIVVRGMPRSLSGTVDRVVAALANVAVLPPTRQASTTERADALEAVLIAALRQPIDAEWVDRLLDAVLHMVLVEELVAMDDTYELTRCVVRAALDISDELVNNHDYRAAVRWADAAGYVDGAWDAEVVAFHDAFELADEDLAGATALLERAIFHRQQRFEVADVMLPQMHLQAASWHTELGNHLQALGHFLLAHPALDATGDPLGNEVISAFRAGSDTALVLDHLDLAVELQGQVIRRLQGARNRARRLGDDHAELGLRRRAMVRDELDLVHLHLQRCDPEAARAVLSPVLALPTTCLQTESRAHTVALAYHAEVLNQFGAYDEAKEVALQALPQARRHFGQHDPLVHALEGLGGE